MIASASVALAATDTPKQPNIVLFLVDDMGWQDTSVPFGYRHHRLQPRLPHSRDGASLRPRE